MTYFVLNLRLRTDISSKFYFVKEKGTPKESSPTRKVVRVNLQEYASPMEKRILRGWKFNRNPMDFGPSMRAKLLSLNRIRDSVSSVAFRAKECIIHGDKRNLQSIVRVLYSSKQSLVGTRFHLRCEPVRVYLRLTLQAVLSAARLHRFLMLS